MRCCIQKAGRAEAGGEKRTGGRQRHAQRYDAAGRLTAQTDGHRVVWRYHGHTGGDEILL
nr:hypothetical protein [Escherichia coli]